MKKLRNKTLRFFNLIWSSLLSFFGLLACGVQQQQVSYSQVQHQIMCKYGVPTTTFEIRGKVTDETGKPVQQVEVKTDEETFSNSDTTNVKGEFYVTGTARFMPDSVQLIYRDVTDETPADTIDVALKPKSDGDFSYKASVDGVKIVLKK